MQDTSEREEGETDDKKREKGGGEGGGKVVTRIWMYVMLQLRLAWFEKRTRGRERQTTRGKKKNGGGGGGGGGRYTYLDVYYVTT